MKLARVTGTVVSTVKYEKYRGLKLLKIRHLDLNLNEVGEELVALDAAGAGVGDIVLANNDGGAAQMILEDKKLIAASRSAAWSIVYLSGKDDPVPRVTARAAARNPCRAQAAGPARRSGNALKGRRKRLEHWPGGRHGGVLGQDADAGRL
jgi:microcompartment protein CcmK/EutM